MGKRTSAKPTVKGVKMESQKNVEVKKPTGALQKSADLASWGQREIRSTSVVIPRILKMEYLSDMVKEKKAAFGEFRDSLSGELLGNIKEGLKIIPIEVEEKWLVFDIVTVKNKDQREFKEVVPVTAQNENWKYKEPGLERDRVMDVYCLLQSEIDALPDDWKERNIKPLPKILGFRRTSLKAGKKLYTQMYITNQSKGLPPPSVVLEITGKEVEGDVGSWIVLDEKPVAQASSRALDIAFSWFTAIKSGATKIDDTELKNAETTTSGSAAEVTDY